MLTAVRTTVAELLFVIMTATFQLCTAKQACCARHRLRLSSRPVYGAVLTEGLR